MSRVRIASYRRTLTAPFVCPLFDVHLDPTDFRERAPRPKTRPLETERCVKNFRFRRSPPPPARAHRFPFSPSRTLSTEKFVHTEARSPPPATVNASQGGYSCRDPASGNWEIEPNLARINYSPSEELYPRLKSVREENLAAGPRGYDERSGRHRRGELSNAKTKRLLAM